MKNLKYCVCILLFFGLTSCDEDKFSSVKVIEFPEHESKLAVTSHLSDGFIDPNTGTVPSAFVSNSLGILDNKEFDLIKDATVQLFKNGDLLYDFTYDENFDRYLLPDNYELNAGSYTMEVSAPNFADKLTATQEMPSQAEIVSATYEFEKVPFDFDDTLYDLLKLKINDPADEENYYGFEVIFEVQQNNGEVYDNRAYSDSDDPLMEYGDRFYLLLPDIAFNGKSHDVRLLQQSRWYTDSQQDLIAVRVKITTLTKDYYLYDRSRALAYEADGNPFAEPVLVHSNFDNGFGVFTLSNEVEYRIEF